MKKLTLILGMYAQRLSENVEEIERMFKGCDEVHLYDVAKSPSGHGHFKISLELIINGLNKKFEVVTSNMQLIDDWNDDEGNIQAETIMYVLEKFEDDIREYVVHDIEE